MKAVVPQSTFENGFAVLNADDDLVYNMKYTLACNIALFSLDANNPRIKKHCSEGGLAAFVENNYFVISKGQWKTKVVEVAQVPLTFSGKCEFMVSNVLPALLVASLSDFPIETITSALLTFIPSATLTPGRMNQYKFKNFEVMIDYAHNTAGYIQLKKYVDKLDATQKTGVIAATGDRREEDIKNLGRYAAQMFDKIIIRHDRNNRGRTKEQLNSLLIEGIHEINSTADITVVSDEIEAIQYAIDNAIVGEFIFMCPDNIQNTLAYLDEQIEKEKAVDVNIPLSLS